MASCLGFAFADDEVWIARRPRGNAQAIADRCRMKLMSNVLRTPAAVTPDATFALEPYVPFAFATGNLGWFGPWVRQARRLASPSPGRDVEPAAVAVPPTLSGAVRQACRDQASDNGWPELQIVSADLAAVAGQLREVPDAIHVLTIQVGDLATDVSIASTFKGVTRIRHRLAIPDCSLLACERRVAEAIRAGVASAPVTSVARSGDRPQPGWVPGGERSDPPASRTDPLACWRAARRLRQELDRAAVAAIDLAESEWGRPLLAKLTRDDLWPAWEATAHNLCSTAQGILRDHHIAPSALQLILVSGGGPLAWPAGQQLLESLLQAPVRWTGPEAIADGAAWLADQGLTGPVEPMWSSSEDTWRLDRIPAEAAAVPVRVSVTSFPGSEAAEPIQFATLDSELKELLGPLDAYLKGIATVDRDRAEQCTISLIRYFQGRLTQGPATSANHAEELPEELLRAQEALGQGRRSEAIQLSHAAYERARNNADVFRRMVNLHVEAAAAESDDREALDWLECAYAHDQVNREIHQLLAGRYYQYAKSLRKTGQDAAALDAVERCLSFAPFHSDATSLCEELRAGLDVPPG